MKLNKLFEGKLSVKYITTSALIAALYTALTLIFAPISFREIQFRVPEALTLLPIVSAPAIPGLFIGCLLGNLLSGAIWQDIVFGSLATLIAAIATRTLRKLPWLAAFMPVMFNGLIVGAILVYAYGLPISFLFAAATVALGEAAVCYMIGLPLINIIKTRLDPKVLEAKN